MEQSEIKKWLKWLDETFGLDYIDGIEGSACYLWGNKIAVCDCDDKIELVESEFVEGAMKMFEEWRDYNG